MERLLQLHAQLVGLVLLPFVLLYVAIVGDEDWMEDAA